MWLKDITFLIFHRGTHGEKWKRPPKIKCYHNKSRIILKVLLICNILGSTSSHIWDISLKYYVKSTCCKDRRKRKWFLEQSQTELGFVVATSIWSKVWIVSLTTNHQRNFFEIQFRKPYCFPQRGRSWLMFRYLSFWNKLNDLIPPW